jgi:sialidase-1
LQLSPDGTLVFATDETSSRRPLELRVSASALFDGSFHHVAATWSTTTVSVYLDGSLAATAASQGGTLNPTPSTPLRIGAEGGGSGASFPMNGAIDEVALWSRALTATEIRDIVGAGSTGLCPLP